MRCLHNLGDSRKSRRRENDFHSLVTLCPKEPGPSADQDGREYQAGARSPAASTSVDGELPAHILMCTHCFPTRVAGKTPGGFGTRAGK